MKPDLRSAADLILGGLGAGCAVAAYLLSLAGGISTGDLILPYAAAGIVMAIGMLSVWIGIGPRLRNPRILLRPGASWAAREAYAALIFYTALIADWIARSPMFEAIIAAAAVAFLLSQAHMVQTSKNRLYWQAPEMPSLMLITALSQGVGLIAVFALVAPPIFRAEPLAAIAGIVLAMMGAYRWQEYIGGAEDQAPLKRLSATIHGGQHALPFAFYLATFIPWTGSHWVMAAGGVSAICGGALWQNILVTRLGRSRDDASVPTGL